jgi:Bacterial SH3 domain
MKKTTLLLGALFLSTFAMAQINRRPNDIKHRNNSATQTISTAFSRFEETVFTQSSPVEIIASYIKAGKVQSELGHRDEAATFYQRAYQLVTIQLRHRSKNANILFQLANQCKQLLALCLPGSAQSGQLDSIAVDRYLREAQQSWYFATEAINTSVDFSEEKVVTALFHAATEPATVSNQQYRLSKETSLRKQATHQSASLKRLGPGCKIIVIERTSKDWWKVETTDGVGYVKAGLLISEFVN